MSGMSTPRSARAALRVRVPGVDVAQDTHAGVVREHALERGGRRR